MNTSGQPEYYSSGYLLFRNRSALEFLLMSHHDRWDLPKGHLDGDETDQEAAIRELQEETGLPASAIWTDPVFLYTHRYEVSYKKNTQKKLKQLSIFLGFLLQDLPIVPTEHIGYKWVRWQPPHKIQELTIDPLLAQVATHLEYVMDWPTMGH